MSRFGVTITDLNDFLSPSQACIVAEAPPPSAAPPQPAAVALHPRRRAGIIRAVGGGPAVSLSLAAGGAGSGDAAPEAPVPATARVSLSDCLACSGCVTSAETVLMEQQSAGELRRLLQDGSVAGVVIMLAPQALASLALYLGAPDAAAAYARLAWFFKARLGCAAVVDTQVGLDLVLAEAGDEALAGKSSMHTPHSRSSASMAAAGRKRAGAAQRGGRRAQARGSSAARSAVAAQCARRLRRRVRGGTPRASRRAPAPKCPGLA